MGTRSHHKSHRWFDKSATLRKAAKYIHERKIAAVKAEQIRERSGPASMEWMQSALFLYAARKEGMQDDLKKALWAYTSAMIHKLELILTDAEHIAKSKDIEDTYGAQADGNAGQRRHHLHGGRVQDGKPRRSGDITEKGLRDRCGYSSPLY